ncbi:MAG TPA: hypothetical protein VFQ43_10605 [Nitrososphaera sp.]|nr:hypothetical protein [Nitrososphaera sp.]
MRSFLEIESEVLLRFYRWAQKDAEREVRAGYPLLRRIESSTTKLFLNYTAGFSEEDQLHIVLTLLKRVHEVAVELSGEVLIEQEKRIIADYVEFQLNHPALDRQEGLIRFWVPRRAVGLPTRAKLRPKDFSRKIRVKLAPVLMGYSERHGEDGLFFERSADKWVIQTMVRTARPPHYFQVIRAQWRDVITTTITSWLGIGDGTWDVLYEDESESAAATIATLCDHFLKVVPELLQGLDFDESTLMEPARRRAPLQASDQIS